MRTGSFLQALMRWKPFPAAVMPAAGCRRTVPAFLQCFTLRQTCRIVLFIDSMMFVLAHDRRISNGRLSPATARTSSNLKYRPGDIRSLLFEPLNQVAHQALGLVGVSCLPGLSERPQRGGMVFHSETVGDVAGLVNLTALNRDVRAESAPDGLI